MRIFKIWGLPLFFLFPLLFISCAFVKEGTLSVSTATDQPVVATKQIGNAYYHFSVAQLLANKGDIDGAIEEYKMAEIGRASCRERV